MTFRDFKYWLEGFEESISGSPTKKQWDKIQEKMGEVTDPESTFTFSNPYPINIYPQAPWIVMNTSAPSPYQRPWANYTAECGDSNTFTIDCTSANKNMFTAASTYTTDSHGDLN